MVSFNLLYLMEELIGLFYSIQRLKIKDCIVDKMIYSFETIAVASILKLNSPWQFNFRTFLTLSRRQPEGKVYSCTKFRDSYLAFDVFLLN
jgi:hypothetical protein